MHVVVNYSRSKDDAETTAAEAREHNVRAITIACDVAGRRSRSAR